MTRKSRKTVIRAWTDPRFRSTLSNDELAALPANPAGSPTPDEEDLAAAVGGWTFTAGCNSLGCDTSETNCTCQRFCSKTGCMSDPYCSYTLSPYDPSCTYKRPAP